MSTIRWNPGFCKANGQPNSSRKPWHPLAKRFLRLKMVSKRRDEISIGGVLHMELPNEPQRMTFVWAGMAATFALILGLYSVFAPVIGAGAGGKEGIWQPFLPEAELSKLVDDEVKIIQKELGKAKPDEKKIRASALVIALAAQDCKDRGEPGQLTMLRITALGL